MNNQNSTSPRLSDSVREILGTILFIAFISLVFYVSVKINHYYDGELNGVHLTNYIRQDSKETLENVSSDLVSCKAHSDNFFFDDCDDINRALINSVIDTALDRQEIDKLWPTGLESIVHNSTMLNDHLSYSEGLLKYNGNIPFIKYQKALALLRAKEIPRAYNIYLSLRETDHSVPASEYIRGIFKFYGCTTEYEIWGELTNSSYSVADITRTENYPPQEKMPAQFIIAKRLQLASGDSNIITPSCPLATMLTKRE